MFCPRCSQEQVSEETRFCSRCGLPLELIAQVVANDGSLPQLAETDDKQKRRFTRSKGWKFGLAWFLILTFLLAPFFAIMEADELPEILAALGVFGGLFIILFSFIFLRNDPKTSDVEQLNYSQRAGEYNALHNTNQNALPPQQSVPTSAYVPPMNSWKAPETKDLAGPGSVTEGTTKLLEKDE
jgi:hypothetical protein